MDTAEDKLTSKILEVMNDFNDPSKYTDATKTLITSKYITEILDYLKDNMTINVTYAGMIGQTVDPVTTDVVSPTITYIFQPYMGLTYMNWVSYIYNSIFSNLYVGIGQYLNTPTVPTNLLLGTFPTDVIPQSVIRDVYDADCDENGRLRDDVDIAKDCHKALVTEILKSIKVSYIPSYPAVSISGLSTGLSTITELKIN